MTTTVNTNTAAATAAATFDDHLLDDVEGRNCASCLTAPTSPYLLSPCFHSCCRGCLPQVESSGKCPRCNVAVTAADESSCKFDYLGASVASAGRAKEDFHHCEINCTLCRDGVRAASHCPDCREFLCTDHVNRHKVDKPSHKLVGMEAFVRSQTVADLSVKLRVRPMCKDHASPKTGDGELKYFCQCREVMCNVCCLCEHSDHGSKRTVVSVHNDMRGQLKQAIDTTQANADRPALTTMLHKAQKECDKTVETAKASVGQQMKLIHQTFKSLHEALEQRKSQLVAELEAKGQEAESIVKAQREELVFTTSAVQRAVTFAQQIHASPEAFDAAYLTDTLCERLRSFDPSNWPLLPKVSGRFAAVVHEEPLVEQIKTLGEILVGPVGDVLAGEEAAEESAASADQPGTKMEESLVPVGESVIVETTGCTHDEAVAALQRYGTPTEAIKHLVTVPR